MSAVSAPAPRARIALGLLLLAAILAAPNTPERLQSADALRLPAELPVIVFLLALCGGRLGRIAGAVVAILALLVLVLKLLDIGTFSAFARPFDPLVDFAMLADGWQVASGAVGRALAAAGVAGFAAALVAVGAMLVWSLGGIAVLNAQQRRSLARVSGVLALFAILTLSIEALAPVDLRTEAMTSELVAARVSLVGASIADRAEFRAELSRDPLDGLAPQTLFSALRGKDVVIVFVESYGRSAIEDPRYGGVTGHRLAAIDAALGQAGLGARSGWLTSPTFGGQSWLAHGALLSGLWTNSKPRYEDMLTSPRRTLNALFRSAGWRTVAVMPAITLDWPESAFFGYDAVFAAKDLGYRGAPFNWVTMPDQYTLSAFERLTRPPRPRQPVMATMALISSHAPWTPIPKLLDWDVVGDGSVFTPYATAGDPPDVVWRDPDRVRRQYGLSIDYTLEALGSFMARAGKDTVFIVLGDHQPAPIVTGPDASRDVPVSIVSDDPDLLARLGDFGWTSGMKPAPGASVMAMSAFREWFVKTFSEDGRQ